MLYRFEGCTLDLTRGCLEAAGHEVELRPKCFDVLRHLLENGNRLISKEELVAAAWPQVAVTDESLARCISDVRAAIADHEHKIIKTVPRRGYLFTADVTRHEHAEPQGQQSGSGSVTEHVLTERPSIAVLAFTSMNGDPDQEYFSDGTTEDIITELSRFTELRVIARNSSFRYKGRSVDVRQVGRELGGRYVLEGSVRRAGKAREEVRASTHGSQSTRRSLRRFAGAPRMASASMRACVRRAFRSDCACRKPEHALPISYAAPPWITPNQPRPL